MEGICQIAKASSYSSSKYGSYYTTGSSGTAQVESIIAGLGVLFGIIILIVIAVYVLTVIGQWKLFKKAGKEGYIALIPVYNVITEMELAGMPKYWWFLNYCSILSWIPLVGWIASIGVFVFAFWKNIELAKAFGKGSGTGVLLTFFPYVMYPVLGFGNAEYVGPANKEQ